MALGALFKSQNNKSSEPDLNSHQESGGTTAAVTLKTITLTMKDASSVCEKV